MGTQVPPKGAQFPPQFSAHAYCGETARWIKKPLSMEVGLGSGDIVFDGTEPHPHQKGHSPQFSARVYCGQTAGCISISLGMDTVLDGDPVPPK